jgi:hypothetical protein
VTKKCHRQAKNRDEVTVKAAPEGIGRSLREKFLAIDGEILSVSDDDRGSRGPRKITE